VFFIVEFFLPLFPLLFSILSHPTKSELIGALPGLHLIEFAGFRRRFNFFLSSPVFPTPLFPETINLSVRLREAPKAG